MAAQAVGGIAIYETCGSVLAGDHAAGVARKSPVLLDFHGRQAAQPCLLRAQKATSVSNSKLTNFRTPHLIEKTDFRAIFASAGKPTWRSMMLPCGGLD